MADYSIYHDRLDQALDAAIGHAQNCGAEFSPAALFDCFATGGIPYGATRSESVAIDSLKGRGTRKGFHVSIYRMDSGRYELTCYIL